jgi:NAD(P)-dependent dehydrogenase (short-subunit alcohol dehydrogenase family)
MQLSNDRFEGQTVIVAGAGSGIGRASTVRLLNEGAKVIAADVSTERLSVLSKEFATEKLRYVDGNIGQQDIVDKIVAASDGRIDGIANVAGIMDGFLPSAEIDDATWDHVMNVNVTAIMRLTRGVLPLMLAAKSGSIVNVSSEARLRGSAAGTAYTTSKHAVIGFTKSTAFFYTPSGIRCNAVAPGAVATNIEAPFKSAFAGERLGPFLQVTVPPVATADELAAAITWLLSSDSANISGAVLASDGGWAAV